MNAGELRFGMRNRSIERHKVWNEVAEYARSPRHFVCKKIAKFLAIFANIFIVLVVARAPKLCTFENSNFNRHRAIIEPSASSKNWPGISIEHGLDTMA